MGAPLGHAGQHRQDRLGPVQRLDLRLLVHAQHQRPLRWVQVQPDDVTDLVDDLGSLYSLKVSVSCGLRRNAFQIRTTVDLLSPDRLAIDARDQWVASVGVSSRVATTTASTCSSLILLGAPGRGSSTSPSSRRVTNRDRHLPTVGSDTRAPRRPACWWHRWHTPARFGSATPAPGSSWPAATSAPASPARHRSGSTALSAVLFWAPTDTTTPQQRISDARH